MVLRKTKEKKVRTVDFLSLQLFFNLYVDCCRLLVKNTIYIIL